MRARTRWSDGRARGQKHLGHRPHYTEAYWADIKALNIRQPMQWSMATDYVPR
jgi:hypothetical protein